MSVLIAISYESTERANSALEKVRELESGGFLDTQDLVVVEREADGNVKLHQHSGIAKAEIAGGALLGGLLGLVLLNPLIGIAAGAGIGAVASKARDYGIDDNLMKSLGERLQPGAAAIFMLVNFALSDAVIEDLAPYEGTVMQTELNEGALQSLKEQLDAA